MPQNLADFAQRGAVAQHLRRQPVAKLMGTCRGRVDASAQKRMPNDGCRWQTGPKAWMGALHVKTRGDWC